MFNWFNTKKKSLPQQVLENTKDIEKLYDQELSDITQLNYKQDAEESLTYADGKATFKGKMSIIRNENTQNIVVDSDIEVNISSGDDNIIIDAGEDNVSLKIRLDNATKNKINRALLTPISAPNRREFVTIGTNNIQENVFFDYENAELKIDNQNIISLNSQEFNDLYDMLDFISVNKDKNFYFNIGILNTSTIKSLMTQPDGFANYTTCYARAIGGEVYAAGAKSRFIIEIYAIGDFLGRIAKRYLFSDANNERIAYLSDWEIIR